MTEFAFSNGHIVTPGGVLDEGTIQVADGRISAIVPGAAAIKTIDLAAGWLVPGFIDTQVNGGAGMLFNNSPDIAGIAAIGRAHARFGTTAADADQRLARRDRARSTP